MIFPPLRQINALNNEPDEPDKIDKEVNEMDKLLTPKEAAKILNVSLSTLAKWRQSASEFSPDDTPLKYVKMGKSVRYREVDLEKFINSNIK